MRDVWAEASTPPVPAGLLRMLQTGDTVWVEFEAGVRDQADLDRRHMERGPAVGDLVLDTVGKLTLRASELELRSDTAAQVRMATVDYSDNLLPNQVTARAMVTSRPGPATSPEVRAAPYTSRPPSPSPSARCCGCR